MEITVLDGTIEIPEETYLAEDGTIKPMIQGGTFFLTDNVYYQSIKDAYDAGKITIQGSRKYYDKITIKIPAQYSVPVPENPFLDLINMITVKNVNRFDDGTNFIIELALKPEEYEIFPQSIVNSIIALGGSVEGYNPPKN